MRGSDRIESIMLRLALKADVSSEWEIREMRETKRITNAPCPMPNSQFLINPKSKI
ncbi:MAG: hypothetical protein V7K98_14735 [Nostoc sp.]|uniref:hypothetical protein n=1 Tax=Nostoc sp. TaxID=1180 RepID=UPI002FFBC5AD